MIATRRPQRQNGGRKPSGEQVHPSTHGCLSQLGANAVMRKLTEARENRDYWTMKKVGALLPKDRIAAAARALIWTGEVAACERRLRELTRTEGIK